MKQYRLDRLFNATSNRYFDVAIDHGFFNELGMLSGLEDINKAVEVRIGAAPDAIQLTVRQARHLKALPGRHKPSLVLRTDFANIYRRDRTARLYSRMIEEPVKQAVRLDAI
jgi:DhnA family fructose-bisphosphate aldolase class Ia